MALFHTTVVDNQIKALDTIGTATGSIATFDTDRAERLVNLEVAIVATQSGSGTPSPSNPRTINGFSACNLSVNGTTETISFGQTVYGGRLNVGSGVLTITHGYVEFDGSADENWNFVQVGSLYRPYIYVSGSNQPTNLAIRCNEFTPRAFINRDNTIPNICWLSPANECLLAFNTNTITTLADWKTWLQSTPLQVVYELATPLIIQLDSKQIQAIIGTNNIYSDTGDIIDLKFVLSVGQAIS